MLTFRAAASLDSLGWVAIGFSDYGALAGADLCAVWRDWRGGTHMADVHTDGATAVCTVDTVDILNIVATADTEDTIDSVDTVECRYCKHCRYCRYCSNGRYCRYNTYNSSGQVVVDSQQDCKHFRFRSRRLEAEAGRERLEWSWTRAASTCDKAGG